MQPGLYIAHHHWLDSDYGPGQLYKVGHSGVLGMRLNDSAYVTCFPPGWYYIATFEVATKEEAFYLETAMLHCCRHRRVEGRELVRMTAAELLSTATAVAGKLQINIQRRDLPVYPIPPAGGSEARGEALSSLGAVTCSQPRRWSLIEGFTVPPRAVDPPAGAPPENNPNVATPFVATPFVATPFVATPFVATSNVQHRLPSGAPDDKDDDTAEDAADDAPDDEDAADKSVYEPAPLEIREYQRDAVAHCLAELRRTGKAILQMACRCGKTPVAYGVLCDFLLDGGFDGAASALYLVPGLSLLRQTAQKLASYGFTGPILLVGSDSRPVPLPGGGALGMTTDPAAIRAFIGGSPRGLVISTYQSSPQVPTDVFGLTIYDEAHRICGGQAARPFNHAVGAPRVGARLFMSATPAYDAHSEITMKDRAVFGGVAYRYHLHQGIAAGHVNDFRLEIVPAPSAGAAAADVEAAMPAQLAAAMGVVDKLLVFCRNIGHAVRLCAALGATPLPPGVAPFECLAAHSRMAAGGAAGALRRFATPGARAVLFNCRLFQEGVEIPALNGVFFAAPRHSPRDIIQSICRPLNRQAGKADSVIFLPVLHDPARQPDDPANLKRYASIVPFVDALLDEDPRLYEHLLDPAATPYPIGILGTHSLGAADGGAILAAVRRAVRYGGSAAARPAERLLRVENIPWARAYGEIRRVVEACGRYPKTTDLFTLGTARASLHNIYRSYATRYQSGGLEPYQAAALEALPGWAPYGIEGPYPWGHCMAFLERWLEEHDGVPPMVNINNGGYVGLDASDLERLSGCLTCINQGDGRASGGKAPGSGFTISAEKQADLARICSRFGLRWRKDRDPSGALMEGGPPTFIQEAYARFKDYYKTHGASGPFICKWFEGFPLKHKAMERLDVQGTGAAPERVRPALKSSRRRLEKTPSGDDAEAPMTKLRARR